MVLRFGKASFTIFIASFMLMYNVAPVNPGPAWVSDLQPAAVGMATAVKTSGMLAPTTLSFENLVEGVPMVRTRSGFTSAMRMASLLICMSTPTLLHRLAFSMSNPMILRRISRFLPCTKPFRASSLTKPEYEF